MTAAVQPINSPEQLFTQWQRGLFVEAFRILQKTEDAEDCLQEAALRMVRSWSSCNPATAQGWAFAIVRNQAFDILRKRSVRTQATEEPFGKGRDPSMPSHEAAVLARLTLAAGLARLTYEEREAIALWMDNQRSMRAVGAMMHSREYRALGRLRRFCRC